MISRGFYLSFFCHSLRLEIIKSNMKIATAKSLLLTFAAIILLAAAPGFAQDATIAKIDGLVNDDMRKNKVPGVSVAVVKNGNIVYAKGYGLANVELNVLVKPETIFQSGSMGKQFTATAVMMLVEEGKINLDEKIGKYLGAVPDSWKNISVRHLLTHTAGLANDFPMSEYQRDFTEDEILKRAEALPVEFAPGERWAYSNVGYKVLGILIGKVSGKFYGDFLQERIFKPLGMNTTRIISEADIVPNRAAGYRRDDKGELKNQEWVSPTMNTTADGSLYLTTLDLAKWDAALYTEKLLKKPSFDQMWTPVKLTSGRMYPYGFGWSLNSVGTHRVIEHGGAWQGFTTHIARYVDDKLTVIVLDNMAEYNPGKLAHRIAAAYNAELAEQPAKIIEDKEPQITAQVKKLIESLAAGTVDPNLFNDKAKAAFFPNIAAELGVGLKQLGALNRLELIARKDEDQYHQYRYRLVFKDANLIFTYVLDAQGKIAGMQVGEE